MTVVIQGVFVKDLICETVDSAAAIDKVMQVWQQRRVWSVETLRACACMVGGLMCPPPSQAGYKNRTVGATLMNAESSRSHRCARACSSWRALVRYCRCVAGGTRPTARVSRVQHLYDHY
jgi:hypothetical protein